MVTNLPCFGISVFVVKIDSWFFIHSQRSLILFSQTIGEANIVDLDTYILMKSIKSIKRTQFNELLLN